MDPHERLGTNQSAKIEAECLTTAQSTAKMQVRSGSKSLSVILIAKAEQVNVAATTKFQPQTTAIGDCYRQGEK
jgi:hypothetical protein